MNNITCINKNIDTIKNDQTVKLPWVAKVRPKLRKELA